MRFFLFEEFNKVQTKQNDVKEPAPNPLDPTKLFNLLYLFTLASNSASKVSKIEKKNDKDVFTFLSNQPNDDMKKELRFEVIINKNSNNPFASIEVITFDGEKQIAKSGIEIKGENDIEVIINNFFDFTDLYNDGPINSITNDILDIKTVDEIKQIIKDQNTTVKTTKLDTEDTKKRKKLVLMSHIPGAKKESIT